MNRTSLKITPPLSCLDFALIGLDHMSWLRGE